MKQEIDLLQYPKIVREPRNPTPEQQAIARQFGEEFFDGDRSVGYGGYRDDGRYRPVALRLMAHYGLWRGSSVLDVGCAKGYLVRDLRMLCVLAWGLDVSEYALRFAGPSCGLGNATDIPWPDKSFDLVVSIATVHNLERQECIQALREIERVGRAAYITVDAWHNHEEKARMQAWNLTARTMLHVDDWRALFDEAGYTGDYGWFIP